jgi:hypothetical protein
MEYNDSRELTMSEDHLEKVASRWLLHSLLWGLGGSENWKRRAELGNFFLRIAMFRFLQAGVFVIAGETPYAW